MPLPSPSSSPFSGTSIEIPATIQVEHFDHGGEGIAYHDSSGGVDLGWSTDTGGGQYIGWTQPGEWTQYTIYVPATANYNFDVRVASHGLGGTFHLEIDGIDVTGPVIVPHTGGWQVWQTLGKTNIPLTQGQRILRLVLDKLGPSGGIANFNWIKIGKGGSPTTAVPAPLTPVYTLTVVKSGTGRGTVSGNGTDCGMDCSETLPAKIAAKLTALSAPDSTFDGWSTNCPDGAVTMTANTTCAAIFNLISATPPNVPTPTGQTQIVTNSIELAQVLNGAVAKPGDTILLRGGVYVPSHNPARQFVSLATGTETSPITIKSYPGERAIINGTFIVGNQDGKTGAWTVFRDLEFADLSTTKRVGEQQDAHIRSIGQGVTVYAPNVKFINNVLHDQIGGFGVWSVALNTELYGNIIYYFGYTGKSRGHGHGIYAQNEIGTKRFADNIIFSGHGYGFHFYTQAGGIEGLDLEGNIVFKTGALAEGATPSYSLGFLIGSVEQPADRIRLLNNIGYNKYNANFGMANTIQHGSLLLHDNYFIGNNTFYSWSSLNITGNTFWKGYGLYGAGVLPTYFPNNTFYAQRPTGAKIFVRRNKHEQGRGHVVIFNWDNRDSIQVDLSALLNIGDEFTVVDVQNLFGSPVASGRYSGPISIPMHGENSTVTKPSGVVAVSPKHTPPEFGVFLVRKK
jgi:hypothetical protein